MKGIILISNGIIQYDGRLKELYKLSSCLGKTTLISRSIDNKSLDRNHIPINTSNYIMFLLKVVIEGWKLRDIDTIFIDNRKAILPGFFLKLLKKDAVILQDVRELYLKEEVKHFAGRVGCYLEEKMIRKADVIICANTYRASIMKEYFNISKDPIVFENIRKIQVNQVEENEYDEKYRKIFKRDTIKIISTSGYSVSRTNDVLVKAMANLGDKYELLLVGGGNNTDKRIIEKIITENKLKNVNFIQMVEESELKYLIQNSHIGIVNYHQKDTNNKFCASGKIYEFMFEGIPVVTTSNKPLLDLVKTHSIGEVDDGYFNGIKKVSKSYTKYKENVNKFIYGLNVEEYIISKCEELKSSIQSFKI